MPYGKICSLTQDVASVVANWIWQIVDLSIRTLLLASSKAASILCHVKIVPCSLSLLSAVMSEELYMLEAFFFFFRLHSAKYCKENEGKPKVIIPKN